MSIEISIPTQLRPLVGGAADTHASGSTVSEILQDLGGRYPEILPRILDESGDVRRFINLYVDDENIRFLQGLATPVGEGARVTIIPAVAGGA
jgi:molybdopterin converting factor small subunit